MPELKGAATFTEEFKNLKPEVENEFFKKDLAKIKQTEKEKKILRPESRKHLLRDAAKRHLEVQNLSLL